MQLENIMRGLLAPSLDIEIEIAESEKPEFDKAENAKTVKYMEEAQMFGPKDPSKPSSEFWRGLANYWRIAPDQAKRKLCSNCEYGDDSPECKEMYGDDAIYCNKFEFVCGDGKTCKRWESAKEED
jgi:uncharacterized protein (DUF427 family)